MRVTKLSLMAVLLLGSSAFAIENTKVSGDAKLYYGTMDSDSGTYLGNKRRNEKNERLNYRFLLY